MKPKRERILGSRPHGGKDVSRTSLGIVYRVMGSNLAPEISMHRTPCPVCPLGPTLGQEAIRYSPRANTMATKTKSLAYRHRISFSCSRETEKKEKFPGARHEACYGPHE